ncbi:hypothetical protein llap_12464 [Limosa lapponica baueri]|uniref:Uncharacterized protein n=1 Tax=Limosa lapponica baueri TaxID=1758121 RepID=A0A2I0TU15_LIMLA|nr:hypothetical protein llap_12464 [Limosa lapponica baueri]
MSPEPWLCPWPQGANFSKENSQEQWTCGEGQPCNPEETGHVAVATWHGYVFFSLCQDLNNLPWGARKKENSGEDGDQGSLQEDTNVTARRGEKNLFYAKVIFHSIQK